MLDPDADAFPMNVMFVLKTAFESVDPEVPVFLRPIQVGDPVQAWAITASLWTPDDESWEMLGGDSIMGATINRYILGIQCFNQDMDRERGLQVSATMAGIARSKLSRDPVVRASLAALQSTELGFTESARRFYIQGQRFLSNEIERTFYHLSNLEFLIETEIH